MSYKIESAETIPTPKQESLIKLKAKKARHAGSKRYLEKRKAKYHKPEVKAKISKESKKKYYTDPEYRAKKLLSMRTYAKSEKGKQKEILRMQDPIKRQRKTGQKRVKSYNITIDEYQAIFIAQGKACAACKITEPKGKLPWHIDHDHSCCSGQKCCGKCIRGILCYKCNSALGLANDDIDRLKSLIAYLSNNLTNRLFQVS